MNMNISINFENLIFKKICQGSGATGLDQGWAGVGNSNEVPERFQPAKGTTFDRPGRKGELIHSFLLRVSSDRSSLRHDALLNIDR